LLNGVGLVGFLAIATGGTRGEEKVKKGKKEKVKRGKAVFSVKLSTHENDSCKKG